MNSLGQLTQAGKQVRRMQVCDATSSITVSFFEELSGVGSSLSLTWIRKHVFSKYVGLQRPF